jgi:hypothetical protein
MATRSSARSSGLLTGKYREGIPDDSRGALPGYEWLARSLVDPGTVARAALEVIPLLTPEVRAEVEAAAS